MSSALNNFHEYDSWDFENDLFRYEIISTEKMEVEITGTTRYDRIGNNMVIPDTVIWHNCKYTVTSLKSLVCLYYSPVGNSESIYYLLRTYPHISSISIPKTVTEIEPSFFSDLSVLNEIHVDTENPKFTDIDGILYNKNTDILIACPSKREGYIIPNSVKVIGNFALSGRKKVTKVEIPESVTSIGSGAFIMCDSLKKIKVAPENAQYRDIDGVLFNKDISKLIFYPLLSDVNVAIPNTVNEIGDYAFFENESITSIAIPPCVSSIGKGVFSGCLNLRLVDIPSSVVSIGDEAFYYCESLRNIDIPSSVTDIGTGTFAYCSNLKSISIPMRISEIKCYSFNGCSSLEIVNIPSSVISIGDKAFCGCTSLKEIIFPESLSYIGNYAFNPSDYNRTTDTKISALKTIKFKSLTPPKLGQNAFYAYSPNIYIPKGTLSTYKNMVFWYSNSFRGSVTYHEVEEWEAGISDISADTPDIPQDVYTSQGICVKRGATKADIDALPKGLYIAGGKKVYVN